MSKPELAPTSGGPQFEQTDVSPQTYGLLLGVLLGAMVFTVAAIIVFRLVAGPMPSPDPFGRRAAVASSVEGPPRLQSAPQADLRQYLKEQRRRLNDDGWVDRKAGLVRIPIGEAKRVLLEHGWPSPDPPRERHP